MTDKNRSQVEGHVGENTEYIDHISGCNYVIKAYSKIVCHALSRYA